MMFTKKQQRKTAHHHPAFAFTWRTDFHLWLIAENPDMRHAHALISATYDGCEECMISTAQKTATEPIAVLNILGSALVWAQRNSKGADLVHGDDPVFRKASSLLIRHIEREDVSTLVKTIKDAPRGVLVDILEDSIAAILIPHTAEWSPPLADTAPPWVTSMDRAREQPPHPNIAPFVAAAGDAWRARPAPTPPELDEGTGPVEGARDRALVPRFLSTLRRWTTRWRTTPPDGGQGGQATPHEEPTPAPAPVPSTTGGPPRPASSPTPPAPHEDVAVAVGLVHDGRDRGPVSLADVRRLVDGDGPHQTTTNAAQLRALLWEHAGDTAAVRAAWKATHGQAPPSDVYRYARKWVVDVVDALARSGDVDPLATLARLVPRRTAAMDRAVDAWATDRATVTHLRATR